MFIIIVIIIIIIIIIVFSTGRLMIFYFSIIQVYFVFRSLNFIVLFSISYKNLKYYVFYYCILIN